MKAEEIIELGTKLGLPFNRNDNYKDMLERNIAVFNGANSQRFLIDGSWTDEEIYERMGKALKAMGSMELRLELHSLLSIMRT
jgi:hypothetical protein